MHAAFRGARTWLLTTSWQLGQAIRAAIVAARAALGPARAAAAQRIADAHWRMHESAVERTERFRAWRESSRTSSPRRERLAYAWWQLRTSSIDLAEAARTFRAQHRRASTLAIVCVFLALALAGTGAAFLTDRGSAESAEAGSTDYIVVTGPSGTRTYAVTVTTKGKKQTLLRVVHRPGGGVKTLRDTVSVDGPTQALPGQTITTKGQTKTVTVAGPGVTETETETQVVTETVVLDPVTVTETVIQIPVP
jgi:hypothetical protein